MQAAGSLVEHTGQRSKPAIAAVEQDSIAESETMSQRAASVSTQTRSVKLFLCGDVMTGRGIDQVLPHPGEPQLFEPYMRSALVGSPG